MFCPTVQCFWYKNGGLSLAAAALSSVVAVRHTTARRRITTVCHAARRRAAAPPRRRAAAKRLIVKAAIAFAPSTYYKVAPTAFFLLCSALAQQLFLHAKTVVALHFFLISLQLLYAYKDGIRSGVMNAIATIIFGGFITFHHKKRFL